MNLFDKEAHGKRVQKGRQSSLEGDWLNLFSIILKWANFIFFSLLFPGGEASAEGALLVPGHYVSAVNLFKSL